MHEAIDMLKDLTKSFSNKNNRISEILKKQTEHINTKKNELNDTRDSLNTLNRKKEQTHHEIKRAQLQREKLSKLFTKYSEETLKLTKEIVNLESELETIHKTVNDTEIILEKSREVEASINYPSQDKLYLELIKGLGVGFVKRDDCVLYTVKGKNETYNIEGKEGEYNEKIWNCLCN